MDTKSRNMAIVHVASVCHEANRALCMTQMDFSQPSWENAPKWQQDSAIDGVKFHLANPNAKPEDSHNNWLKLKYDEGWKYGPVKDSEKKEHPCCVPYEQLELGQRLKDALFIAVVHSLRPMVEAAV